MNDGEWIGLAALLGAVTLAGALKVLIGVRMRVSGSAIFGVCGFVFLVGLLGGWWAL